MTLHPQFVVDKKGQYQKVLLSIEDYTELLECAQDIIDASLIEEVKNDKKITWQKVKVRKGRKRR